MTGALHPHADAGSSERAPTQNRRAVDRRRQLVVGPSWVGDMVMTQSAVQLLAERRPDWAIDMLAPQWSLPLVARLPGVSEAIALPVGHGEVALRTRWEIARMLRARGYKRAIVIPRTLKAALTPWLARIPQRTGYRGEMRFGLINDMRTLDKEALPQFVQRCAALACEPDEQLPSHIPQPRLAVNPDNAARLMSSLGLDASSPVIAMMPGAEYGPSKKWPAAHYAELALRVVAQGCQVWVLGSPRDRPEADEIDALTRGAVRNICGRTQLVDAVDLIAQAHVAVSNDSGLMHVAAAVGCPVVALYGSTSPTYAPPLTDRGEILYLGLDCSPCGARDCPLLHHRCLKDLTPERVHAVVLQHLAKNRREG